MLLSSQNQRQNQDLNSCKNVITSMAKLQNDVNLQTLIQFNKIFNPMHLAQIKQQTPNPTSVTPQEYDTFRRRCQRIALKNQKLKKQILQLKHHFMHSFNIYGQDDPTAIQESRVTQKIKLLGTQIKAKILEFKQKQSINNHNSLQQEQMPQKVRKQTQKMIPANLKVQEMKNGTEFLFKQLIQVKYDMEATQNFLKLNPGEERRQEESRNRH